jgi:hypothetical protein
VLRLAQQREGARRVAREGEALAGVETQVRGINAIRAFIEFRMQGQMKSFPSTAACCARRV